jgi:hypothetical protein
MKIEAEILSKLKSLNVRNDMLSGVCKSFDKVRVSCDVEVDGLLYKDVRLSAVIRDGLKSWVLYPKEGSPVILERLADSAQWYVSLFSELDSMVLEIGDQKLEVNKDKFVFNGGYLGGLVKVSDLTNRLNNIEQKVNQLIIWSGTHLHSGGGSGTAPGVPGTLSLTSSAQIENPKIVHG